MKFILLILFFITFGDIPDQIDISKYYMRNECKKRQVFKNYTFWMKKKANQGFFDDLRPLFL